MFLRKISLDESSPVSSEQSSLIYVSKSLNISRSQIKKESKLLKLSKSLNFISAKKTVKPKITRKALLVGINYVNTEYELDGCLRDVINTKRMLLKRGYSEDDIIILTDMTSYNKKDPSRYPTTKNIIDKLDWLLDNEEGKKANLYFHYSGHSKTTYEDSGNGKRGINGDSNMVIEDYIRKTIKEKITKDATLIGVIDCCNAPTIIDLKYTVRCDSYNKIGYRNVETNMKTDISNNNIENKSNIMILSGCDIGQKSREAYIKREIQGLMTYSMLKVLRKHKYDLTYGTLLKDIYGMLKADKIILNAKQNPTLSYNNELNIDECQFVL